MSIKDTLAARRRASTMIAARRSFMCVSVYTMSTVHQVSSSGRVSLMMCQEKQIVAE